MPTIRELVAAIRQRDGVEAAIVLGRDGLLIDGQAVPNLDAEGLAAHVPSIVTAADEFGAISQRGQLVTGVFEHPNGLVVDSIDVVRRAVFFRTVHDPNCGYRSLVPGVVPTN